MAYTQYNKPAFGGNKTFTKKPYVKDPTDRAGIIIGVAVNNVFKGLTLADVEMLAKDNAKLELASALVEKLVALQIELMPGTVASIKSLPTA